MRRKEGRRAGIRWRATVADTIVDVISSFTTNDPRTASHLGSWLIAK